jgi:lysylphosphatidylglycerol synthetase-like protein (DUF2156 family)
MVLWGVGVGAQKAVFKATISRMIPPCQFGLAPMSGFREREEASAMERAVYQFFQRLTFLFNLGGLKAYKAKFASGWEPRYVIYRHALDLPKVGIALGKVSKLK